MDQQDLFPDKDENTFKAAFAWWEKKRLLYNLIMGISGVFLILLDRVENFNFYSLIGILLFGLAANACYFTGFLLEACLRHYFNIQTDFTNRRPVIFWIGTILSLGLMLMLLFLAAFLKGM